MIIRAYGIELERLKRMDIELVRQHRNSLRIAQFMEYRDHITEKMQENWYDSINNIFNLYYIIIFKGKKIGLINGAKIDWDQMVTNSGGIFIWEEEYWNTNIPFSASLLLTDISFNIGFKHTYIKVLRSNIKAINYNKQMGYKLCEGEEMNENQKYVLDEASYFKKTSEARQALYKIYGTKIEIIVDDPGHEVTQFLLGKLATVSKNKISNIEVMP
jgi:RimJ/RimL family protein N-acetyltransferase